jgi:hypothetical protein
MSEAIAAPLLGRWQNFYVLVGSAAAALTGLQFVVIALVAQIRMRNSPAGIDAFSTPTIVYFSTVLLLSAVLCAPWNGLAVVAGLIVLCGAAGTVYAGLVTRRAVRQPEYRLVVEDWIWHIALPIFAHAMLLAAGLALVRRPGDALLSIAAAVMLLLAIGIHNAWDTVTFLVIERMQAPQSPQPPQPLEPLQPLQPSRPEGDGERPEPPPA